MRASFLPFALPDVGEEEIASVTDSLRSGWLTTGPKTVEFETRFAKAVGAKHAIAVNSCTAAMHLALEASGVGQGDEVITTPYTFAATAEVIRYFDARPVFVDVDARTLNLRPELVSQAVTPRTKAVIAVHVGGYPAELHPIHEAARAHGLVVVEDAAHAFPCAYRGASIGGLSDFTCFSFYATKTLTTGEGGMICTEDEDRADRCRIMALHGISKDAWKRYTAEGSWYYEIVAPGYKYNLSDVASAIGLAQLSKADAMWTRRRAIAARYSTAFGGHDALETPADCPAADADGASRHAWHLYSLRLNLDALAIDRAGFVDELKRRRIGASVHFIPLHVHPYYRDLYGYRPQDFPVAYREYLREVSLPLYSRMSDGDVEDVIAAVLDICRQRPSGGARRSAPPGR